MSLNSESFANAHAGGRTDNIDGIKTIGCSMGEGVGWGGVGGKKKTLGPCPMIFIRAVLLCK